MLLVQKVILVLTHLYAFISMYLYAWTRLLQKVKLILIILEQRVAQENNFELNFSPEGG